ncbi:hypothetical protein BKP42_44930 [Rhodococcus erythropolis]|uniref:hypothetical protein n=1 Tax=Rhodococcus erythropolis TaxID=1833 RepID=UPI000BB2E1AB|nr:hypothetical protein [Rhodococcus erythropolis]PBI95386.1 hypothetical protein BKP42_44930 [Rhodococcus erythropolis]
MMNESIASVPTIDPIASWFSALGSGTRSALFAAPHGEVPQKYVEEVLTKGHKLALSWFSEPIDSESFRLPEAVADYVDGVLAALQRWWIGLSNERRLQWANVENGPVPNGLLTSYPGSFEFVPGDDVVYADPQVIDFIAVAAA